MKHVLAALAMVFITECGGLSPGPNDPDAGEGCGEEQHSDAGVPGNDAGPAVASDAGVHGPRDGGWFGTFDGGGFDGGGTGFDAGAFGYPYLTIDTRTCDPLLIGEDAGSTVLPWDGGELPLLDSGIRQWHYTLPNCDLASLRLEIPEQPDAGLGINAASSDLQQVASLMVGEWTGTRTTRWDGTHPLTLIFFESGRYSIATGDCTSPTYYGVTCGGQLPHWSLTSGDGFLAAGWFTNHHPNGGNWPMTIQSLSVNQTSLRFELWNRQYGPIEYELERVNSCASQSVTSCP